MDSTLYLKERHNKIINKNKNILEEFKINTGDNIYEYLGKCLNDNHSKILDLGCGVGSISKYLKYSYYLGIDIAESNIDFAIKNSVNENADYKVGDICNKLEINTTFDYVIASSVLHLLKNSDFAIKESFRLLNKNGQLIILTPSYWDKNRTIYTTLFFKLIEILNSYIDFELPIGNINFFEKERLIKFINIILNEDLKIDTEDINLVFNCSPDEALELITMSMYQFNEVDESKKPLLISRIINELNTMKDVNNRIILERPLTLFKVTKI